MYETYVTALADLFYRCQHRLVLDSIVGKLIGNSSSPALIQADMLVGTEDVVLLRPKPNTLTEVKAKNDLAASA